MAKKNKLNAQSFDKDSRSDMIDLLKQIDTGFVTHVSEEQALALGINTTNALIDVNLNNIVDGKALAKLTPQGHNMINGGNVENTTVSANTGGYEILTDVPLPPRKRLGRAAGGNGKYPFDKLEVGQTFFVGATPDNPSPVKKLASTISAQNAKWSVETGEFEVRERTKRGPGNRAVKDADGNKVKEQVKVALRKPTRKFSMRGVKAGETSGSRTFPIDGVLIGREY